MITYTIPIIIITNRVKDSEFPFNAESMVTYFSAIIEKMKIDGNYVRDVCLKQPDLLDDLEDGGGDGSG